MCVARRIAKDPRFERLPCDHKGTYADDCLVKRVEQHKCYIIATCDKDLKRRIRKIPGVPIMYIHSRKFSIERFPDVNNGAPESRSWVCPLTGRCLQPPWSELRSPFARSRRARDTTRHCTRNCPPFCPMRPRTLGCSPKVPSAGRWHPRSLNERPEGQSILIAIRHIGWLDQLCTAHC